jgi:hypothetical protein
MEQNCVALGVETFARRRISGSLHIRAVSLQTAGDAHTRHG